MNDDFDYYLGADAYVPLSAEQLEKETTDAAVHPKTQMTYAKAVQLLDIRLISELKMERAAPERIPAFMPFTELHADLSNTQWFCKKGQDRNAFYVSLLETASGNISVTLFERERGIFGGNIGNSRSFPSVEAFVEVLDILARRAASPYVLPPRPKSPTKIDIESEDVSDANDTGREDDERRVEYIRRGLLAIAKTNNLPTEPVSQRSHGPSSRQATPIYYNPITGLPQPGPF